MNISGTDRIRKFWSLIRSVPGIYAQFTHASRRASSHDCRLFIERDRGCSIALISVPIFSILSLSLSDLSPLTPLQDWVVEVDGVHVSNPHHVVIVDPHCVQGITHFLLKQIEKIID